MNRYITMSVKETERISVMEDLKAKRIKQKHAAKKLRVSDRQIRRMLIRYKKNGAAGLIHTSRGRVGNRAIDQKEKGRAINLVKKHYIDFGPTLAHEKLTEHHGIRFGVDTLRAEMITQGLWKDKKRKENKAHPYRQRRACIGELVQLDGSPHAWFENRGNTCTLLAFIDDATSMIMDGMFVTHEGTYTFFEATERYLKSHGKPLTFYVDKHSTFKINRQATIEEDLRDIMPQTQYARAMEQLHIEMIFAHSPQAKGRVERMFETLQDRLVKEMRLAGISTKEEGTRYFREVYIAKHNNKFASLPREKGNLHRPLAPTDDLSRIFTQQSKRIVSKNLTVQYKNVRYQLKPPNGYRYTLKNAKIKVIENKREAVLFCYKNIDIPYTLAVQKQIPINTRQVVSAKSFTERRVHIPAPDHPWRQGYIA